MTQIPQANASDRAAQPLRSSRDQQPLGNVGPWQLVQQIGEGPLTRVYQARPVDGRMDAQASYAVKLLRSEWNDDPTAVGIMQCEASVGHRVSHPHVVPILASNVKEPPYFLAMPLLPGTTLARRLAAHKTPATPVALWIARQVAEGLNALYTNCGMMHADIKPSNIFVASDGHATLLDLGFARTPDQGGSVANRPVVGTVSYIAPEMVTSALAADIRSDIYSLGVTLYEMLTGRLPFTAKEPGEIAVLHREAIPHCIQECNPDVPNSVSRLVHRMLSKEPLRRPQTPRELIDLLVNLEIETFDRHILA